MSSINVERNAQRDEKQMKQNNYILEPPIVEVTALETFNVSNSKQQFGELQYHIIEHEITISATFFPLSENILMLLHTVTLNNNESVTWSLILN